MRTTKYEVTFSITTSIFPSGPEDWSLYFIALMYPKELGRTYLNAFTQMVEELYGTG